jgi:hypothetical protein
MPALGSFALSIQPRDPLTPARIKLMVQNHVTDADGRVFITPECFSFDELESYINALQDDLDLQSRIDFTLREPLSEAQ